MVNAAPVGMHADGVTKAKAVRGGRRDTRRKTSCASSGVAVDRLEHTAPTDVEQGSQLAGGVARKLRVRFGGVDQRGRRRLSIGGPTGLVGSQDAHRKGGRDRRVGVGRVVPTRIERGLRAEQESLGHFKDVAASTANHRLWDEPGRAQKSWTEPVTNLPPGTSIAV
jgi:hypothetical protein